jgi:hypothetical protein
LWAVIGVFWKRESRPILWHQLFSAISSIVYEVVDSFDWLHETITQNKITRRQNNAHKSRGTQSRRHKISQLQNHAAFKNNWKTNHWAPCCWVKYLIDSSRTTIQVDLICNVELHNMEFHVTESGMELICFIRHFFFFQHSFYISFLLFFFILSIARFFWDFRVIIALRDFWYCVIL